MWHIVGVHKYLLNKSEGERIEDRKEMKADAEI